MAIQMQFHLLLSFRYSCMWSSPISKSKRQCWKVSCDMWGVPLPPFPSSLNNPNCISLAYTFHMHHQSQTTNLQNWFYIWQTSVFEVNPLIKIKVYLICEIWTVCLYEFCIYLICIYTYISYMLNNKASIPYSDACH